MDSRQGHAGMTFGGEALDGMENRFVALSFRARVPRRGIRGGGAMDSR